MARGINKAILVGHLGNDPEVRYLPSGGAVANFSVATSEKWTDKQTGEQKEATEWHRINAFGKLAEIIGQYATKGTLVYIEGKIKTRKCQDNNGNDRQSTEIVADVFRMLSGGQDNRQQQPQRQQRPAAGPADLYGQAQDAPVDFDDDIQF